VRQRTFDGIDAGIGRPAARRLRVLSRSASGAANFLGPLSGARRSCALDLQAHGFLFEREISVFGIGFHAFGRLGRAILQHVIGGRLEVLSLLGGIESNVCV